jgi:hypothetical protein
LEDREFVYVLLEDNLEEHKLRMLNPKEIDRF